MRAVDVAMTDIPVEGEDVAITPGYDAAMEAAAWAELCAMGAERWDIAASMRQVMEHLAVSNVAAARVVFTDAMMGVKR